MAQENYTNKIVELLDGELSVEESKELHSQIATDSQLQKELSNHIKLKNMISKGVKTPPDALKAGILQNVGLTRQYPKYLYAIPILLAFGLGYLISGLGKDSSSNQALAENSINQKEVGYSAPKKQELSLSILEEFDFSSVLSEKRSFDQKNQNSDAQLTNQNSQMSDNVRLKSKNSKNNSTNLATNNEDLAVEKSSSNNLNQSNLSNNLFSIESDDGLNMGVLSSKINIASLATNQTISNLSSWTSSQSGFNAFQVNPLSSKSEFNTKGNISLELRGLDLNNFHESDVENLNTGINNFAVSAYYSLNEKFKIGAEFGQENFIQKYSLNDGEFTTFYEQNYTSNFLGISAKYQDSFLKELPDLNFYSRAFLGGMMTGPMGRLEVGLSYNFFGYTMFVGYDLAHISYFYENSIFHTTKSGVTYGVSFNL